MKRQQVPPLRGWSLTEATVARRLQEEPCTLLTVKAAYPVLVMAEGDEAGKISASEEAAERFNDCYARAAEAFVSGGLLTYGEKAREEFSGLSARERHLYLRRELVCSMAAAVEPSEKDARGGQSVEVELPQKQTVTVDVRITYGTRRERQILNSDHPPQRWSFPKGILMAKTQKKLRKTIEK